MQKLHSIGELKSGQRPNPISSKSNLQGDRLKRMIISERPFLKIKQD
jgi:hypothetical protein